jgi:DNA repair ATPase RecN
MSIKINSLQAENVKRIKAVTLKPSPSGLTVIGGKNGQGKTSVLDAITWALGGDKHRPSEPRRDGSTLPPALHVELSNGLTVERKGKNSDLKVVDPSGNKAGQKLLDSFVSQFALDLPRFMNQGAKEKARTLLEIIGVGDKLYELDDKESKMYVQRTEIGRIAEQKKHAAAEMESYPDVPDEPVSASELIRRQQDILARNGENEKKREHAVEIEREYNRMQHTIEEAKRHLEELIAENAKLLDDLAIAQKSAEDLIDESTAELEASISEIDETNRKVRINQDKEKAESEAADYAAQYEDLTAQIEAVRTEKMTLLDGADLPLDGLSVQDGELTYNGYKWDNMSGSDQMKVATAIVRKLNPECGFVLLDKLEQMDVDTLNEFGEWLKGEDLQAIATRVSTGGECEILIQDGYAVGSAVTEEGGSYKWN